MASTLTKYDLDLKLAELKINGYTMFEDLVSAEKIDRIHDAFMPLLDAVRDRNDPMESGDRREGEGPAAKCESLHGGSAVGTSVLRS